MNRPVWLKWSLSALLTYVLSKYFIYRLYLSPINRIPGPRVGWIPFLGNFKELVQSTSCEIQKKWAKQYGGILSFHGPGNDPRILVTDPALVKLITLTEEHKYGKSDLALSFLRRFIGNGLLVAEGEAHRFQRKMMNPAFSVQSIRALLPLMTQPVLELRNQWLQDMAEGPHLETRHGQVTEMVVSEDLSSTTLDIIGSAGFGQHFHSLRNHSGSSRLSQAYLRLFAVDLSFARVLALLIPITRHIPTERRRRNKLAFQWLRDESAAVVQRGIERAAQDKDAHKDLLSIMVGLIDEDTRKGFTPEELREQCLTFLAAGHETTSVSMCWALWLLAQHQSTQSELREEVRKLFVDDHVPSYEDIQQLPLLNNVCKETLRLIPPVPMTSRTNLEPVVLNGYTIPARTMIFLAPIVNHHSSEIWGDDADTFNPYRWEKDVASVYEYMPFLAGTRQCIGMKFALMEMKILLAYLIRDIQFFEKDHFKVTPVQQITAKPSPNMTLWLKPV